MGGGESNFWAVEQTTLYQMIESITFFRVRTYARPWTGLTAIIGTNEGTTRPALPCRNANICRVIKAAINTWSQLRGRRIQIKIEMKANLWKHLQRIRMRRNYELYEKPVTLRLECVAWRWRVVVVTSARQWNPSAASPSWRWRMRAWSSSGGENCSPCCSPAGWWGSIRTVASDCFRAESLLLQP